MVAVCLIAFAVPSIAVAQIDEMTDPSAMNEDPPSPEKLELIREFMRVTGIQGRIDSGRNLERYAFISELNWDDKDRQVTLLDAVGQTDRIAALRTVYARYRSVYQEEFESHINWEFTESELREMVAFFGSPTGQHYFDGTWRMNAYTGTNLEEVEQQLVEEAVEFYNSGDKTDQP